MVTSSFPAVGNGGLTEERWSVMYGSQDGIIEDYMLSGVEACAITRNNTTNKVTVKPGKVRVNGYVLSIDSDTELDAPAPGAGTAVYTIAAQYDPELNVADEDDNASEDGPCRLIITNTALDYADGKQYTVLYTITRTAAQSLTAATVVDARRWTGPWYEVAKFPAGVDAIVSTVCPRGTVLFRSNDGADTLNLMVRTPNDAGTALRWLSTNRQAELPFPAVGGLVAYDVAPRMERSNGRVYLSGSLKRSNGANLATGSAVTFGTLPVGWRPDVRRTFPCGAPGTFNFVLVAIYPDGLVQMIDPAGAPTINGIWLDGIAFKPTQ